MARAFKCDHCAQLFERETKEWAVIIRSDRWETDGRYRQTRFYLDSYEQPGHHDDSRRDTLNEADVCMACRYDAALAYCKLLEPYKKVKADEDPTI